ncbi:MAG TPA: hypothetical protein VMI30_13605 [Stellaceae bacterium]|nr:hypothetical protein [Stellaceae bacterium]
MGELFSGIEALREALRGHISPEQNAARFAEHAEIQREHEKFQVEMRFKAKQPRNLALECSNDDDAESAIIFAEIVMHDDQAKSEMLAWCLDWHHCDFVHPRFLGCVLAEAWWRPKGGSLISHWGFDKDDIAEAFERADPRGLMSDDRDFDLWCSLRLRRKPITIWRGAQGIDVETAAAGMSWTTDRAIAEKFTCRYKGDPILITATVAPRDIIAAWRGESEIVVLQGSAQNAVKVEQAAAE